MSILYSTNRSVYKPVLFPGVRREKRRKKDIFLENTTMKPLLPVLRENNRYLCFEVISDHPISRNKVIRAVRASLRHTLGLFSFAEAHIRFMERYSEGRNVFKVTHSHLDDVKAGLALISRIDSTPAAIHTIGVSGVVHKAYDFLR